MDNPRGLPIGSTGNRWGPFSVEVRKQQVQWALAHGITVDQLEDRAGAPSWVLRPAFKHANLFSPAWWAFIAGKEHRWARALNSSQCFAVNLFAPLKEHPTAAWDALARLLPGRELRPTDTVTVEFEHAPPGSASWLGERGQPTQVDVCFRVDRAGQCLGHVLVEVKYTESGFGTCRGWSDDDGAPAANPSRDQCLDVVQILRAHEQTCWLARTEGRRYWNLMADTGSAIRTVSLTGPCPFRRGLYQLMRNRVLADELRRQTGAAWSELAVCRHPKNAKLLAMKGEGSETVDPIAAFRAVSAPEAILDWPADHVFEVIRLAWPTSAAWRGWIRSRYFA
jgi:hypothetical protein